MLKSLTVIAALAVAVAAGAQVKKVTTADFAGTWNIEVLSHQIAMVIEPAEGNKVTATMMMMGRDTLLKGELADRTLTLVGIKTENNGNMPATGDHAIPTQASTPAPQPILVTLLEDGMISGEMMTSQGPVKWTGEKLKTKKKS